MIRRTLLLTIILALLISAEATCNQNIQIKPAFENVNLFIINLAIDQDGFVWIATGQGLFRYDGIGFTPFSVTLSDGYR